MGGVFVDGTVPFLVEMRRTTCYRGNRRSPGGDLTFGACDVDPGKRFRVNESPHPSRLGRGLHHETHQAHSGADQPQGSGQQSS